MTLISGINVHGYYLEHCRRTVAITKMGRPRVLKADLWNEVNDNPVKGGILGSLAGDLYAIEYNEVLVNQARSRFPKIQARQGDIRKLPWQDDSFDCVLDCSTIDHVPPCDTSKVIGEYARVTKDGGFLLLISWFHSLTPRPEDQRPWSPENQYYHDVEMVRSEIERHYHILEEETFWKEGKPDLFHYLRRFLAEKGPGPQYLKELPWSYLQTKLFDQRLMVIAEYLKDRVDGKRFFDLDCGTARLLRYIPPTFALYYGNDKCDSFLREARRYGGPNTLFEQKCDVTAVREFKGSIDVLLLLGWGGGEHVRNVVESETLTDSFKYLVQEKRPPIVILEGITLYEERYRAYTQFKEYMGRMGYLLDREAHLDLTSHPDRGVRDRKIFFYVKKG